MVSTEAPCRCGHARDVHEHYRRGSDCGICGREVCARYLADPLASVDAHEATDEQHPPLTG